MPIQNVDCDRCHRTVKNCHVPEEADALKWTSGYYDMRDPSGWGRFATKDEERICDECMWADPGYQAEYGTPTA